MVKKYCKVFSPVMPVSAQRPRITRYGSYFTGSYKTYRTEQAAWLKANKSSFWESTQSVYRVNLEFICKRPKKPVNPFPRYDLDNMEKAILDSLVNAKLCFGDDIEIVELYGIKRYQEPEEDFGTIIEIQEL